MKYAVEMASGIIKSDSGIQKLMGGESLKRRQHGDLISLVQESTLKIPKWVGL
jgi:hypothetical protein